MLATEVNQILIECDRFAKLIETENKSIKLLLENPNKEDTNLFLRSNKELIKLTKWRLEQLASTLEHVGWWRKKVVNSYINRILQGFELNQRVIELLKIKSES